MRIAGFEALGDKQIGAPGCRPQPDDVILANRRMELHQRRLGHNVLFPTAQTAPPARSWRTRRQPGRRPSCKPSSATGFTLIAFGRHALSSHPGPRRISSTAMTFARCAAQHSTGEPLERLGGARKWQARFRIARSGSITASRKPRMVIGDGPEHSEEGRLDRPDLGAAAGPWVVDDQLNSLTAGPAAGTLAFGRGLSGLFLGFISAMTSKTQATVRGGLFVTRRYFARIDCRRATSSSWAARDDCFKRQGPLLNRARANWKRRSLSLGQFEEACVFPIPDREDRP